MAFLLDTFYGFISMKRVRTIIITMKFTSVSLSAIYYSRREICRDDHYGKLIHLCEINKRDHSFKK
jgi:hypothetical protein